MNTALVTGASSGIGLELTRLLAADGKRVVLAARSTSALEQLAASLPDAVAVTADLSTPAGVAALVETVPDVDVLVNNAGVGDFGAFVEADPDRTMAMIQLNVAALTQLTRRYLPAMVERGSGKVLNVASTAAFQPGPLMAVYYATKAYVLSFSEALAEELRGSGVTVTALCPGPTASGFQDAANLGESRLVKERHLPSAADVAASGYRAMQRGDVVHVTGLRNKVLAASVRFTPRPVMRRLVHRLQSADRANGSSPDTST
ncbi:MAG: SDR family oxidoreductase [Acidimicrobiia bacterium]|nr:SDR family oxidoreductase [Acidimicrobiia bacterium]